MLIDGAPGLAARRAGLEALREGVQEGGEVPVREPVARHVHFHADLGSTNTGVTPRHMAFTL